MKTSPDPSVHRARERQLIEHVTRLLGDARLRVDTTRGRRAVTEFAKDVTPGDRGTDVKRAMSDLNRPDRDLQSQMPLGETVDVVLSQKKWGLFKQPVGRLHVACVSPTRDLIAGAAPKPMTRADVTKALGAVPPGPAGVPTTVVIVATAGVVIEAHEMADRGAERTVILVEPNDVGGWNAIGPVETKSVVDLFDPEPEDEKRARLSAEIESAGPDLGGAGLATDRLAAKLQLPLPYVEASLKAYAKDHPGLVAKRLDGRLVLFREGSAPPAAAAGTGGSGMPLIAKMKALFARRGETEKKVAFLAERRAALSQQRDRAYEELTTVEGKESILREQFRAATSEVTKRRVTGQMLQLRKDLDRRQQMLGVYNQQIDVVSTHLHNLELLQQGKAANLPDSDEITADAARAEEMLAGLQASTEAAAGASSTLAGGLTAEEQALFEELERETADAAPAVSTSMTTPTQAASNPSRTSAEPATPTPASPQRDARRAEPEAG